MEHQPGFSEFEFTGKRKKTRREEFLESMDKVVPWDELIAEVRPYYPKGKRGRPPVGLERMLRLYFLQQWYGLADEALEDAVYDSQAMRGFLGISLATDNVPDATTLLKFRHLLEAKDLCAALYEAISKHLEEQGMMMREGTLVDATIINAPSSTKNDKKKRDPDMSSTRKGGQWYFGMKAHIGVDADSGLVHTVVSTTAKTSDISQTQALLHGEETHVHADAGYIGVQKREEIQAHDPGQKLHWHIARKRSEVKALPEGRIKELTKEIEKEKSRIRSWVEHPFHIIKNLFKYRKARYRGLSKNNHQLLVQFGLANLVLASRRA